jgi:hypothetical protein
MTKSGLKEPNYFGSVTQAATCRVGNYKGEEIHVPFKGLLPLAEPESLVIGGWDISNLNLADSMKRAQVCSLSLFLSVCCWIAVRGLRAGVPAAISGLHACCTLQVLLHACCTLEVLLLGLELGRELCASGSARQWWFFWVCNNSGVAMLSLVWYARRVQRALINANISSVRTSFVRHCASHVTASDAASWGLWVCCFIF